MATEENKSELTEEQKEFLASCEQDFSDRYTSADIDFLNVKDNPPNAPPIVDPWYSRARHNFDRSDRRGHRGGNSDRDRGNNYRDHRHQNERSYDQRRQGNRYNQHYRPY